MQKHHPAVVCLQVHLHLPDQHPVIFNPESGSNIQDVLTANANKATTLTGWFIANAESEANHDTLYQDFPSSMVWNKDTHRWTPRKQYFAIGRMYHALPSSGEHFYLRLLLTSVKGATFFDDHFSFDGTPYNAFREACIAHGLLKDDHEWHQCLTEAGHMAMGQQPCYLFVEILCDCTPEKPRELWDTCCLQLNHNLQNPSDAQVQDYGLYLIDKLLSHSGKCLKDWDCLPQVEGDWGKWDLFILEQRDYDPEIQACIAKNAFTLSPMIRGLP